MALNFMFLLNFFRFPQNLKKSWHPQTLKNIERVWKAEQKHEAERKKIEELQKELKDERAREEITKYAQETGAVKCVQRILSLYSKNTIYILHYVVSRSLVNLHYLYFQKKR